MFFPEKLISLGSSINRTALAGAAVIGALLVAGIDTASGGYRTTFRAPAYRAAHVFRPAPAFRSAPVLRPAAIYRPAVYRTPAFRPAPMSRPMIHAMPMTRPTPAYHPVPTFPARPSMPAVNQRSVYSPAVSHAASAPPIHSPGMVPPLTITRPTGASMPVRSKTPRFSVLSPSAKEATTTQPIAPGAWSNKTTTPATRQNAPRIPASLVKGVSTAADATQLGVKALESWKKNPISPATLGRLDRAAVGVGAVASGVAGYQAYQSGDRLGAGIHGAQALAGGVSTVAGSGANALIRNGAPLVGTVGSMAHSAQSLGTALGTGNRWNLDKGLAVGAAATEFVGKGAAAGAGYLVGGAAGANTAVTAADVALGAGKWAGDKFTDTQTGKRLTDGWFHIKTNEDRAAQYDRQIEAIRAQRIINGQ